MWYLDLERYKDKAYAGWLGKNIGGTLGAPVEGNMNLLDLTFYPDLPEGEPLPNDDLDLQLVWLHALEQAGPRLKAKQLGEAWAAHVYFPFDEYGYALHNLRRGIVPPVSGWFNNPFADCMGAPIRSEIWAMIAPGLPELAAYYAWQDAVVDHAGGEGVWGEVLFAAIQSAAFIESDPAVLINLGMSFIPEESRVAKAVRHLIALHAEGASWIQARERILEEHGNDNFTDAPQNIAFTLLGWLYGESFEDALLKSVNCGYDTDCTAATLGAILGMTGGTKAIPEKWSAPIGDKVVLSPAIVGIDCPGDLNELTGRTLRVAHETLAAWRAPLIISPGHERRDGAKALTSLSDRPVVSVPLQQLAQSAPSSFSVDVPYGWSGLSVDVDYGPQGPAIGPLSTRSIDVTVTNNGSHRWTGKVGISVPSDWSSSDDVECDLDQGETAHFTLTVTSGSRVVPLYETDVVLKQSYDNGRFWKSDTISVAFVPEWHWEIQTPAGDLLAASSSTTEIPFPHDQTDRSPGWWRATTKMYSPKEQEVVLIVATMMSLKVKLRDDEVLRSDGPRTFMPAYHRPVGGTAAVVTMQEGKNELEIDVLLEKETRDQRVMVAIVSPTVGKQHAEVSLLSMKE